MLSVPATEVITEQTPAGRVINSSNFFPRISPVNLLMVIAKKDSEVRNARARALFELVSGEKKMVEYYTAAIKGAKSLNMSMHVPADRLDDLQPDFDSILNNVTVK